jgi:hypothetical protein
MASTRSPSLPLSEPDTSKLETLEPPESVVTHVEDYAKKISPAKALESTSDAGLPPPQPLFLEKGEASEPHIDSTDTPHLPSGPASSSTEEGPSVKSRPSSKGKLCLLCLFYLLGLATTLCHWAYYIHLDGTLVGSSYVQQQNIRSVPSSSCLATILTSGQSKYCSCGFDAVLIHHCRLALVHPDALASHPLYGPEPKCSRCGLWSNRVHSVRSKPGDASKVQKGLRPGTSRVVSPSPRLLHPGDALRQAGNMGAGDRS